MGYQTAAPAKVLGKPMLVGALGFSSSLDCLKTKRCLRQLTEGFISTKRHQTRLKITSSRMWSGMPYLWYTLISHIICYRKVTPTNIDGFVGDKLGLDLDLAIHGGHSGHVVLPGVKPKESSTNLWSIPVINIYHRQRKHSYILGVTLPPPSNSGPKRFRLGVPTKHVKTQVVTGILGSGHTQDISGSTKVQTQNDGTLEIFGTPSTLTSLERVWGEFLKASFFAAKEGAWKMISPNNAPISRQIIQK